MKMKKKKNNKRKKGIVIKKSLCYTRSTPTVEKTSSRRKEEELMTEFIRKIEKLELPPHVLRDLGLKDDWKKEVSQDFLCHVVSTAEKYKNVLKELSKY
jgi:hypothetical protein